MRQALFSHRENLGYFESIESRLQSMKTLGNLLMKPEEGSQQCYQGFKVDLEDYATQCSPTVEQLTSFCHKEIQKLEDRIKDAELELHGWKRHIEKDLQSAKSTLCTSFTIPADVWAEIFEFTIYAELDAYLQKNMNRPLRSMPHILSHVCQFWRKIVRGHNSLWNVAPIHPCSPWSQNKYDLFSDSVRNAGNSLLFVANLSQYLTWSYKQVKSRRLLTSRAPRTTSIQEFQNHHGKEGRAAQRDGSSLFQGKPYKLCVDMADDHGDAAQKLSGIPCTSPHTLVLSSRKPLQNGQVLNLFSRFSHTSALVILNKSPVHLPTGVSTVLHNLTSLKLKVGTFPEKFQLSEYLLPNLKELQLRDDGGWSLPTLTANIQLPHLQTLGINYPARKFLEMVEMSAVETLVLYPFDNLLDASPTSEGYAISTYSQLVRLKFEDWSKPTEKRNSYGSVEALTRLASKMPTLVSVAFDQCHVDGEALVQLVSGSKGKDTAEGLEKLEAITLNRTEGITRQQCDELKALVEKFNVYI